MAASRRLVARFHALLLLCLALSLAAPLPSAAARPGAVATQPAATSAPTLGPAVTGIPGLPDGARELLSRRTRTSRTYANSKGTLTTLGSLGSMNYPDATGTWQPVDNTLVADSTPGDAAVNRANRYQVHLPTSLAAGPVKVTLGSLAVSFGLEGASGSPAALSGSVARYADALPGVAVAYAAASDSVEEALTLASPAAPSRFVYSLATSGLTARANAHGGVDFLDGSGNLQFAFLAPVMEDAAHARSASLTLSLGSDASGQTVSLTADPTWLASPARQYPVVVDPDLVTTTGDTQDCPLDSLNPTTSSCGLSYLAAGANGSEVARSLLQFPLALRGEVLGATLGLYQLAAGNTTPATVELHQVTRPWTTAATWTTADGSTPWTTPGGDFVAAPAGTANDAGTSANGAWLRFTPGALAAGWNDGSITNDGVLVKTANEGTTQYVDVCPGGGKGAINGCTAAEEPYLAVTWTDRLGERPWYPLLGFGLTDRMGLAVNVANGNLVLHAHDVGIAGTGLPLVVDRLFNDLGADQGDTNELGPGWVHTTGSDLWLDLGAASDGVVYHGVGGDALFYQATGPTSYATPPGEDATLIKNGDGSFTLTGHGSGVRFQFDAAGNLTAEQDRNGNALAFAYNNDGRHSTHTITDTQGRVLTFSYTNPSFPTAVTQLADWTGRTWQYGDDAAGELTTYTDPANQVTRYAYTNGDLTRITDPLGNVTTLTYASPSPERVTSITFGAGSSVAATYQFTYNTGNTVVTDPNTHQTTYSYDGQGRQTKVVDALGNTFQWAWTSDNHVQTYTDGKNQAFTSVYDDTANPPLCSTQVGTHNLCSSSLPTGATTRWSYQDGIHPYSPTSATDPQGNTVSSTYDTPGNLHVVSGKAMVNSQSAVTTISETVNHNPNGTVSSVQDFNTNTWSYAYDAKGNLTQVTPPAYSGSTQLGPTKITPDPLSRPAAVFDGKNQERDLAYDLLDRTTAVTFPAYASGNVSSLPDADGNTKQMTDSNGTTSYFYDARNRQTQKTLPAGLAGGPFVYGYDGASHLLSYTDAGGKVTYHYNAGDELDSLQDPSGAQTSFGYDANHLRTSTAYPDGVTMAVTPDASGRLSNIKTTRTSDGAVLANYSYSYVNNIPGDPYNGKDTGLVYQITENDAPGVGPFPTRNFTTTQSYDPRNLQMSWLVKQGSAIAHDYEYQYDADANRTQIVADASVATPPPNPKTVLQYNPAGELTSTAVYANPTTPNAADSSTWSYDGAGNQTGNTGYPHLTPLSPPLSATYDGADRTASVTDVYQQPVAMGYTGAGQAERTSIGWSNQPSGSAGPPAKPAEFGPSGYAYSALGLASRTDSTGTTYYTNDPSGLPIGERTPQGTNYYVYDGQGNVVMLVDPPSGQILALRLPCPTGNDAGDSWQLPGTHWLDQELHWTSGAFGALSFVGIADTSFGGALISQSSGVWAQGPLIVADASPGPEQPGGAFGSISDVGSGLADLAAQARADLGIEDPTRNVAVAQYEIDGISDTLVGVSGTDVYPGTVPVPQNRLFRTFADGGIPRQNDAEVKVLEALGSQLDELSLGHVDLYTERYPCESCMGVVSQFEDRFPGVSVGVYYGPGIPVPIP